MVKRTVGGNFNLKITEKLWHWWGYMYSEILEANYFVKCPVKLWKVNDLRLSSGANRKLSLPVDPGINPKSLFSCLSLFLSSVYCTAPPVGFNLIYTHPDINHINLTSSISKGGFFQKVHCVFQISKKNILNHYPELEI